MRTCKICKTKFEPQYNSLQKVCSARCAVEKVRIDQIKEFRKETRKKKKTLQKNDRSYQLKRTQTAFNTYIRERDKHLPCISCGRHHQGQYHAGHYRTVGAHPELRFNELNCHKQCAPCNNHKSGDIVNYRINLEQRIGKKNLEWLEGPHQPQKWSIEDIEDVYEYYREKIKLLGQ